MYVSDIERYPMGLRVFSLYWIYINIYVLGHWRSPKITYYEEAVQNESPLNEWAQRNNRVSYGLDKQSPSQYYDFRAFILLKLYSTSIFVIL